MNVETRYYQVMKSGLSYELDSDIHYYHHFKIGELLVCEVLGVWFGEYSSGIIYKRVLDFDGPNKWETIDTLDRNTHQGNSVFTLNWDSIKSEKINFIDAIESRYLEDVTKCVKREWKLELIGI